MARQKGTANFSGTLEVLAGGPIDSRTVVPTLADLTVASNFPYAYVGMETYVVSENKKYRLIAADVTQSSSWEEIGSGGGGGLPAGGITGQMLVKHSNTDGDAEWVDPIQVTTLPNAQDADISTVYQYIGETDQYYEHGLTYKISTREGWGKVWTPVNLGVTIMPSPSGYISGDIHQYLGETTQLYTKGYFYQCQFVGNAYKWVAIDTQFTNYTKSFNNILQDLSNYTGYAGEVIQYTGDTTTYSNFRFEKGHFYKFKAAGSFSVSNIEHVDVAAPLEKASGSTLGGIKVGNNLSIDANGVLSATTPLVANQFDKANIYSTSEKIVGCWTDGRPLYQRTYTGNITVSKGNDQEIGNLGSTINVKDVKGCYTRGNKLNNLVPLSYSNANGFVLWFQDNGHLYVQVNDDLTVPTPYWLTIQYTKTTDAANSFNYADENDYSTSEKRIGTWIDGKPIYQKTIYWGTISSSGATKAHGISNLKKVIKIEGNWVVKNEKGPLPYAGSTDNFSIEINGSNLVTDMTAGFNGVTDVYVTIKYTKTTD